MDGVESSLIGAWRLVTVEDHHPDGSVTHPYGEDPVGYLIYHPDGYMSATLMQAGRQNLAQYRRAAFLTADEAFAVVTTMGSAYAGTWELRDANTVVHHVEASLIPNMTGMSEVRPFELDGDLLRVYTLPRPGGDSVKICAIWRRAAPVERPT